MQSPRTFIVGSPRSGTTWVGKLFDANPWVIYRHEPDSVLPATGFPSMVESEDYSRYLDAAGEYLDRLFGVSTIKTNAGKLHFHKAYRGGLQAAAHRASFLALRAAENIPPLRSWAQEVPVPDLVSPRHIDRIHQVAKSVVAGGRVGLFARARPEVRFVLVLRHPAGFVASQVRGKAMGKMVGDVPVRTLARMPGARERGLTPDLLHSADDLERCAWWWVLVNEKMIADTQDCPNCLLVNYDAMCTDPASAVREMYDHAGIPYTDEVARFLDSSTLPNASSEREYFSLFHDPEAASNRWRSELSDAQIGRIQAISANTYPGSLFTY